MARNPEEFTLPPGILRLMQGGTVIARIDHPRWAEAEAAAFHYALQFRSEGDVTIQRQRRGNDPNPDGKWHWVRHALLAKFPD